MPWFRVDDGFPDHPKSRPLTNSAVGLWVRCGAWSSRYKTDGFIPDDIVRRFGRRRDRESLVSSGLWHDAPTGVVMHDWAQWNPTAAQLRALADGAAERQRQSRGHRRNGFDWGDDGY